MGLGSFSCEAVALPGSYPQDTPAADVAGPNMIPIPPFPLPSYPLPQQQRQTLPWPGPARALPVHLSGSSVQTHEPPSAAASSCGWSRSSS